MKSNLEITLHKFENDINSGDFQAENYFAPVVTRFWEMRDKSPRQINKFWNEEFRSTFESYRLRFDYEHMVVNSGEPWHHAAIPLVSDYILRKDGTNVVGEKSRYEVDFDGQYRIVSIVQVME